MILEILAFLFLIASIGVLIFSWKANIISNHENADIEKVVFYDETVSSTSPQFSSDFKNLDTHVSGAVRYNQSMYYGEQEFKKIKQEILSKSFPI